MPKSLFRNCRRCTAAVLVKHRLTAYGTCPHPARPVLSLNAKQTASEVANGDGIIISKPTFRLARGRGGGEIAPRSHRVKEQYFVAGFLLIQTHAWYKPSKRLFAVTRRGRGGLCGNARVHAGAAAGQIRPGACFFCRLPAYASAYPVGSRTPRSFARCPQVRVPCLSRRSAKHEGGNLIKSCEKNFGRVRFLLEKARERGYFI